MWEASFAQPPSWMFAVQVATMAVGSCLLLPFLGCSEPRLALKSTLHTVCQPITLVILALAAIEYLTHALSHPIWLSEAFILEDANRIIQGNYPNPLSRLGDFPQRIMSYVVALFYQAAPDARLSARIVGILANLIFAVICLLTNRSLGVSTSSLALIFPLASLWIANLSETADNNWIATAPLTSILPFFLYLYIRDARSDRRVLVPPLALAIAWSVYSLYIPAVAGMLVLVLFLFDSGIDRNSKRRLVALFLVLLLPLCGYLQRDISVLNRHRSFITQSGEGNLQQPLVEGYLRTLTILGRNIVPDTAQARNPDRGLFVEPMTLLFAGIGLVAAIFCKDSFRGNRVKLILWTVGCCLGFVISNPVSSFWRTVVIAPALFMLAMLGFTILCGNIGSRWRPLCVGAIIVIHMLSFAYYHSIELNAVGTHPRYTADLEATLAYTQCAHTLPKGASIEIPSHFRSKLFEALSKGSFVTVNTIGRRLISPRGSRANSQNLFSLYQGKGVSPENGCAIIVPPNRVLGVIKRQKASFLDLNSSIARCLLASGPRERASMCQLSDSVISQGQISGMPTASPPPLPR
jgi:hypothetical protein